jgi:hypothetical protein
MLWDRSLPIQRAFPISRRRNRIPHSLCRVPVDANLHNLAGEFVVKSRLPATWNLRFLSNLDGGEFPTLQPIIPPIDESTRFLVSNLRDCAGGNFEIIPECSVTFHGAESGSAHIELGFTIKIARINARVGAIGNNRKS